MNGAFYIGATGLDAQQRALDVIASNIANINTPAFKRSQIRFSELVAPTDPQLEASLHPADPGLLLNGVMVDASPRVFAQGDLKQTGNPMDVAINGDGFIELLGPGGQTMLWRGGSLKVNGDGYLAAANGMPLKAMISAPADATALSIGADGKVQATTASDGKSVEIGQIDLMKVKDTSSLKVMGDGLYQVADDSELVSAAPGDDGAGLLVPGSVESSNVQMTDEMVMLLMLQRAYAANAQVVQAGDQLMAIANSLRR
jgi:flagellar basal-body rod protein FlgG